MQRECCLASGRPARVPRDALGMAATARTTPGPPGRRAFPPPCSPTLQLAPPQERTYDARGLEAKACEPLICSKKYVSLFLGSYSV